MLSTWAVPQVDTFSYTHEGQPWIAKEWLAQVIYAASWLAAGWAGPLIVGGPFHRAGGLADLRAGDKGPAAFLCALCW